MLSNQAADQGRHRWCVFGGLQNRCVSRSEGADQGLKRQGEGIVPGTNDQNAAQGLRDDIRSARTLCQRHRNTPGPHPTGQLALGQLQFLAQGDNFEEGFGGWFAQIRRQGFEYLLFMLLNQFAEALQLLLTPGCGSSQTSSHAVLHAVEFIDGQGHGADDWACRV